jgi:copper(I)-binding protein
MYKILYVILGFVILNLSPNNLFAQENIIKIKEAKIRLPMGSLKSTAAYMTIENMSDNQDVLKSVYTDINRICEIHKTVISNNIHTMVKIDNLTIPANSNVMLAPKGLHVMLIDLVKDLKEDDKVKLKLEFEKSGDVIIDAVVSKIIS